MFVSDKETLFRHASNVTLNIICRWGDEWSLSISSESKVDMIKMMAINHFKEGGDHMKLSATYYLVSIRQGKKLADSHTLLQNAIVDHDELLLIKSLNSNDTVKKSTEQSVSSEGPDFAEIERATADLPAVGGDLNDPGQPPPDLPSSTSMGTLTLARELQPIFVSLVEQAQRVLCLSADAAKLFASVQAKLREPGAEDYPPAESSLVSQLTEMGFHRARAEKALRLHHNVVSEAMDWLLVHEGDPSADDPLTPPTSTSSTNEQSSSNTSSTSQTFVEPMSTQHILHLFREYNRRQFRPLERVKIHFMEMGFDETTVVDALRICNNDQNQAMEYLLNDHASSDKNADLRGLSTDSLLYKALLADPVIQLGLTNPSTLFAFLSILDSPHSSSQWLNNADVGPVLVQISRLYHAEYSSKGQTITR